MSSQGVACSQRHATRDAARTWAVCAAMSEYVVVDGEEDSLIHLPEHDVDVVYGESLARPLPAAPLVFDEQKMLPRQRQGGTRCS